MRSLESARNLHEKGPQLARSPLRWHVKHREAPQILIRALSGTCKHRVLKLKPQGCRSPLNITGQGTSCLDKQSAVEFLVRQPQKRERNQQISAEKRQTAASPALAGSTAQGPVRPAATGPGAGAAPSEAARQGARRGLAEGWTSSGLGVHEASYAELPPPLARRVTTRFESLSWPHLSPGFLLCCPSQSLSSSLLISGNGSAMCVSSSPSVPSFLSPSTLLKSFSNAQETRMPSSTQRSNV